MKVLAEILTIYLLSIYSYGTTSLPFCVPQCICSETTIKCLNANLEKVPTIAAETTVFDLSFNKINFLNPIPLRHLSLLTQLFLNDNQIERLSDHSFAGLAQLRRLHLNKNKIKQIDGKAFKNLHNLEDLYLNDNRITHISDRVFADLPSLQKIYIQNNLLTQLSAKVFESNEKLRNVNLLHNHLDCNCHLLWLKQMSTRVSDLEAQCYSPDKVKDKNIANIAINEFKCETPETFANMKAPVVIRVSSDPIVLHCKVEGNPDSSIEWLHNDKPINMIFDYSSYSLQNNGSKLMIKDMSEKRKGNYRCIARSLLGVIGSEQSFVDFSQQKINDRKVEVNAITKPFGSHLLFNCSEHKEKYWTQNDFKIDYSLQESNRFRVLQNGSLLITNILPIDSAVYKCIDKYTNDYVIGFDLKVSVPPFFTEIPDSLIEVESGDTLRLSCYANGYPEPVIQWKRRDRNDSEINNKILIINNINPSDEAVYECTASNDIGIAVKEVKVKVNGDFPSSAQNFETNDIYEAVNEAKEIVEQAINRTLKVVKESRNEEVFNPSKLLKLARFPLSPESIEFAKSIEIYEKSLEIMRRKAEAKTKLPTTQFKYEELLSPNQLNILAHLSGCLVGHRLHNTYLTANCRQECNHKSYRSYDGICNNMENQLWGASMTPFHRLIGPQYEDGIHLPIGWFAHKKYNGFPKPNPRRVSQQLVRTKRITADRKHSHVLMQFGQFLDHDIDFSMPSISFNAFDREPLDCSRTCGRAHPCFSIEIPIDDIRRNRTQRRHSLRQSTEQNCIELIRSSASCGSGLTSVATGTLMPREQVNQLTAFIDASNVYGSTSGLANHLRDKIGRDLGRMRSKAFNGKDYLPLNEARLPNDCQQDPRRSDFGCFLAGDFRANEQLGLLAFHTLWLREHNRIAVQLAKINADWSGERVYQEARKIVGAQMQFITYYHWLPHILGAQGMSGLGAYNGYNDRVNPSVANVFATAALRFGHTLINPFLLRLNESYEPTTAFSSQLSLKQTFFAPHRLVEEGGIDPLIRGLLFAPTKSPRSDQIMNDQLTEHLFELARDVSLDLGSLNIQRGRDHGLPDYNEWRTYCNLSSANTFEDLKTDIKSEKIRNKLKELYGSVNNIDLWVGAVAEDTLRSSKVGPTFQCLLIEQFRRLRDGDRLYFENPGVLTSDQLIEIKKTSMARIICDNSDNISVITEDVFIQPKHQIWRHCHQLGAIDLNKWHSSLMPVKNCDQDNEIDFDIPVQLLDQLRRG